MDLRIRCILDETGADYPTVRADEDGAVFEWSFLGLTHETYTRRPVDWELLPIMKSSALRINDLPAFEPPKIILSPVSSSRLASGTPLPVKNNFLKRKVSGRTVDKKWQRINWKLMSQRLLGPITTKIT